MQIKSAFIIKQRHVLGEYIYKSETVDYFIVTFNKWLIKVHSIQLAIQKIRWQAYCTEFFYILLFTLEDDFLEKLIAIFW